MGGQKLEVEDPGLAAARILLHMLEEEPPDVLVFGESTLTSVGPSESDQRSLADHLAEALAPRSTCVVAAPGYGVEVHREFVRLAATRTPRPVVVTSLYARGTLAAFRWHPVWGHRRQIELLRSVDGSDAEALRAASVQPTPDDFAAYEAMRYPTLVDPRRTVADFMAELRRPRDPFSTEHLRWLFEFHVGGVPEPTAIEAFVEYGRTLAHAGFPVVAFQNPVSVVEAAGHLGTEFLAWHRHNTDVVRDAFVAGYGPGAVILETSGVWAEEDFIEPAVEHLVACSRARLAAVIADAVSGVPAPTRLEGHPDVMDQAV